MNGEKNPFGQLPQDQDDAAAAPVSVSPSMPQPDPEPDWMSQIPEPVGQSGFGAAAPAAPPPAPVSAPWMAGQAQQQPQSAPGPSFADMGATMQQGQGQGQEGQGAEAHPDFFDVSGAIRQAKHPVAASFHLLFKVGAIVVYFLGDMMPFVLAFVLCILLLAFDFWTTKNVTGRLLVGLRWWSIIQEDGTEKWVFESIDDTSVIGKMDKRIFWWGLWLSPAVWGVFGFIGLLKLHFEWLIVVSVALMLNATQVYGYTKCSKDASSKLESLSNTASNAAGFIYSPLGGAMLRNAVGVGTGK